MKKQENRKQKKNNLPPRPESRPQQKRADNTDDEMNDDVENVADEKKNGADEAEKKGFPGYPYYPSSDDIMNAPEEKIGLDMENPEHPLMDEPTEAEVLSEKAAETGPGTTTIPEIVQGNDADVTAQENAELGDENLAMDMGDDEVLHEELLQDQPFAEDVAGDDLIVPGAELDDEQESKGSEDEENNLYSLGGDNHDT